MQPITVFTAFAVRTGAAALVLAASALNTWALEPAAEESANLSDCEQKLCRQILDKEPVKGPLRCNLGKTWGGKDIKKGASSKSVSWGFGDAQCSVKLNIDRSDIIKALTARKYEFSVRSHNVKCKVETESGTKPLRASLAPKLKFENGRAKKVWIKLKDIDGPEPLSSFVWTTAKLEDSIGIFHSEMIKQINKFVYQKCERRYGARAMARKRRLERIRKNRKLRARRQRLKAARQARLKKIEQRETKRAIENRAASSGGSSAAPKTEDAPQAPKPAKPATASGAN